MATALPALHPYLPHPSILHPREQFLNSLARVGGDLDLHSLVLLQVDGGVGAAFAWVDVLLDVDGAGVAAAAEGAGGEGG